MATQLNPQALNLEEQIARIRKTQADIDLAFEHIRRSTSVDNERTLAEIERIKLEAEKTRRETETMGRTLWFQGVLAIAALLGAGAAIGKLFFP